MKKKLLSTVFALAMGATCTIGFTACGGDDKNNDADTASKAVNYIKALYENKSEETPESYTVNGVSPVDGNLHTVNWSVAKGEGCELNDISAYVSVGAMNTEKQVPITIAKAEVAIPYVLTASVTVGKETKSINFNRKVPAKSAGHAGTQADPYTPSNIRDVASAMESKWDTTADQSKSQSYYYPNNETPTRVYVKGYVVSTGNQLFQDKGTYAQFIYLADTFGKGKKQDDADVIMLMSISYATADSLIKSAADINEGDCLTVSGFIQNYFKDSNSKAQPEISRFRNADGTYQETVCVERVEAVDERTDAQKIDDALAGVPATLTVARTGETALPASSEEDVTFSWTLKEGTAATVADNKLSVAALPAEDAEVVVTVTAMCGTETKTKDVTVTIKAVTPIEGGVRFDFSSIALGSELNATSALELFNSVGGTDSSLTSVAVTKVYQGNSTGGGSYEKKGGLIKFGTSKVAGEMTLTFNKNVSKVVVNCVGWVNTDTIAVNNSEAQVLAAYSGEASDKEFVLATAAQEVKIVTTNRALVFSITVYFAD